VHCKRTTPVRVYRLCAYVLCFSVYLCVSVCLCQRLLVYNVRVCMLILCVCVCAKLFTASELSRLSSYLHLPAVCVRSLVAFLAQPEGEGDIEGTFGEEFPARLVKEVIDRRHIRGLAHTHAHKHTHTHTHTHACAKLRTDLHARAHVDTHSDNAHKHTHMHTRTHTHTARAYRFVCVCSASFHA